MDAREFIINPSSPITDSPDVQVSGTFIFLLNILVKQGVKIMPTSASMTAYNAVDPIGVIIAYCLSLSTFHVQGNSFVDILLAKYHFSCPPLFGIWGSEKTDQGRARLGWSREGGKWVSPTHHFEKLNGLACGWAALTLRDFSKSREKNPLPAWRYWRSIAFILNVPPAQITQSQGVILKGLIEHYAQHFCKSFQQSALNALRMAIIQRPREAAAAGNTALEGVVVLKDTLVKDFAIHL
jgi:nucleoporin GLE1